VSRPQETTSPGRVVAAISRRLWEPAEDPDAPPVLRAWAVYPLLAIVVVALGINWPFLTIGLREIDALWLTAYRVVGSAVVLWLAARLRGPVRLPARQDRPVVLSVGIFRLSVVTMLALTALELIPPGRSSILIYTSSLWAVPVAAVWLGEGLTLPRLAGLVVGLSGLGVLLDPSRMDWTDPGVLAGHGLLLAAAVVTAVVSVHIRGHRWAASPLDLMPWQIALAVPPVVVMALVVEGPPTFGWSPVTVLIVLYQMVVATPFTVWGLQTVLRRVQAITTNLALIAVPLVGVLAAALLVDEALTARSVVSLVLIGLGVWIGVVIDDRRAGRRTGPAQ
jgi:drug/metabolite transporter (DMT)-like permease